MRKIKVLGIVLLVVLLFMLVINIIPPKKSVDYNPFISTTGKPMVIAHRGGAVNNPENTLKAYKASVYEYNVDVLETDLYLTKDKRLVCIHNSTINATTDVVEVTKEDKKHYIIDYTLEELKSFNFGYNFKDSSDEYLYRDIVGINDLNKREVLKQNDLQIITIEELFDEFYSNYKELLFVIEIKNSGELGYEASDILYDVLINKYPDYKKNVVVGTFHDEIEVYLNNNYSDLYLGASMTNAAQFVATEMLKVNMFDKCEFACLQLPTSFEVGPINLNLSKKSYIKRAHRRNLAVQYWTINDSDEMRNLIELGVDGIMTDNPKLLNKILSEY